MKNFKKYVVKWVFTLLMTISTHAVFAASAVDVIGRDFVFSAPPEGMPSMLSDFKGLQLNTFTTSDGVKLRYWEAGKGKPLVFVPGWAANGAEYIYVMYLLSQDVLDPRNQGLSESASYGSRISRFAMDLREMTQHAGITKASFSGWSMGASVLWSYIDLFGTSDIERIAFVDEPPSIYSHQNWTDQERLHAGGSVTSSEAMIEAFRGMKTPNKLISDPNAFERVQLMDSPWFASSENFSRQVTHNKPQDLERVLFDHLTNDWRDVIEHKIDIPTAIFTGEYSPYIESQRWMQSIIPDSRLFIFTRVEQGDHFLMFKNPLKFTSELKSFLNGKVNGNLNTTESDNKLSK
ncbi:alpha/beta fold hydrolase [Rahnella sp. WP5]|uniref:alpha/beta fold hydrolase n=1 Tax=Rahnella sp. WP5 TaxID=1500266 RepID=UPI000AF3FD88|nr:alpha/beta hydrolase [Rahnella sp. WP5]